jgi:hypothetical protein
VYVFLDRSTVGDSKREDSALTVSHASILGGNDGGIGMLCSLKATGLKADTHGRVGEHGGQE